MSPTPCPVCHADEHDEGAELEAESRALAMIPEPHYWSDVLAAQGRVDALLAETGCIVAVVDRLDTMPRPVDHLALLVDDPGNRHRRKERACIPLGVIYPFTRYLWIERVGDYDDHTYRATLYGNEVARITTETVTLDPCGEFTPSTRTAFDVIVSLCHGRDVTRWWPGAATMRTPGSKGGASRDPWSCSVVVGGQSYEMVEGRGPVTIPAEAFT